MELEFSQIKPIFVIGKWGPLPGPHYHSITHCVHALSLLDDGNVISGQFIVTGNVFLSPGRCRFFYCTRQVG